MAIHQIGAPVAPAAAGAVEPKQAFGKLLQQAQAQAVNGGPKPGGETAPLLAAPGPHHARASATHATARAEAARPAESTAARAVEKATSGVKQILQTQI